MERTHRDPKGHKWLFKPLILFFNYLQMKLIAKIKKTWNYIEVIKNEKWNYIHLNSKNKTTEYKKEDLIFIW